MGINIKLVFVNVLDGDTVFCGLIEYETCVGKSVRMQGAYHGRAGLHGTTFVGYQTITSTTCKLYKGQSAMIQTIRLVVHWNVRYDVSMMLLWLSVGDATMTAHRSVMVNKSPYTWTLYLNVFAVSTSGPRTQPQSECSEQTLNDRDRASNRTETNRNEDKL